MTYLEMNMISSKFLLFLKYSPPSNDRIFFTHPDKSTQGSHFKYVTLWCGRRYIRCLEPSRHILSPSTDYVSTQHLNKIRFYWNGKHLKILNANALFVFQRTISKFLYLKALKSLRVHSWIESIIWRFIKKKTDFVLWEHPNEIMVYFERLARFTINVVVQGICQKRKQNVGRWIVWI